MRNFMTDMTDAHIPVVTAQIEGGVLDVNHKDKQGYSLAMGAASQGRIDFLRFLVCKGIDLDVCVGTTALGWAFVDKQDPLVAECAAFLEHYITRVLGRELEDDEEKLKESFLKEAEGTVIAAYESALDRFSRETEPLAQRTRTVSTTSSSLFGSFDRSRTPSHDPAEPVETIDLDVGHDETDALLSNNERLGLRQRYPR